MYMYNVHHVTTCIQLLLIAYFLPAKACAPGHRLELAMASAYCGAMLEDSLVLQAGMPSISNEQ